MPRRQVDDQPPDLAFPHRGQLRGDDLEMPVHRELSLWIEILEAASCEGHEVVPQQDVILGWCQRLHSSDSRIENRALSCLSTLSSASLNSAVSEDIGSVWRSMSRTMSRRILMARKSAAAERLTS